MINSMLLIFMPFAVLAFTSFKRYFCWSVEHDKERLFAKAIEDDIDKNLESLRLKLENQSIKVTAADLMADVERAGKNAIQISNCPNCGAPVNGKRCDYCGTVFIG